MFKRAPLSFDSINTEGKKTGEQNYFYVFLSSILTELVGRKNQTHVPSHVSSSNFFCFVRRMQVSVSPTQNGRSNGSISENLTLMEASQIAAQLFGGFGDNRSLFQSPTTKPRPQSEEILKAVNKENFDPRKDPILPLREKEREILPQTSTKKTTSQETQQVSASVQISFQLIKRIFNEKIV